MSQCELSPLAARLVELLGKRTAEVLCRAAHQVYVPTRINSNCRLVRIIGPAATAKLMTCYAGRHLDLPTMAAATKARRNAEMRQLADEGEPLAVIALRFGLSVRHVRNVLAKLAVVPESGGRWQNGGNSPKPCS